MEMRTWRNQVLPYPVLAEIDRPGTSGVIVDTSCGKDFCPTFEVYRRGQSVRMWVDHPDP